MINLCILKEKDGSPNMFQTKKFRFIEWVIMFFVTPISLVNFIFIGFLIFNIGLIETLKKLVILILIYLAAVLIGLMFLSF